MRHTRHLLVLFLLAVLITGCTYPGPGAPSAAHQPPAPTTGAPPTSYLPILPHTVVDASTMTGRLLMGYQGWFTCPGDGNRISNGYYTWIRDGFSRVNTDSFAVEMWPDTRELTASERCPTDLKYADGSTASVYSAVYPKTVLRHFQWMSEYGIDGVFLQRFGGQLFYPEILQQRNAVTVNVRTSAETYGRVWAIMYDVTGMNERDVSLVETLEQDWKYLVDVMKVTESPAYLHHNGLPVLAIWGLGFFDRPGTPDEAKQLVDFFENNPDPKYRVTLLGGVPFWWRTLQEPSSSNPAWADYYCSLDVISPWTVGAFTTDAEVDDYERIMAADIKRAKECGAEYMPVVYPGHSWHSANPARPLNEFPRRGGRLYWRQIYTALSAGSTMIYNAMFDEVNEGTAMYKIAATSADAPVGLQVVNMDTDGECLPNDWYLRLAGAATRVLRGEAALTETIPISAPPPPDPAACKGLLRIRLHISTTSDWTTVRLEGVDSLRTEIVSSSPEASGAYFDANLDALVLTQTIEQANAGRTVQMTVDAFPGGFSGGSLIVTIGRGNIGSTTVELYALRGSDQVLVKTLEWSGIRSGGENLSTFEIPASSFGPAP
jgi:hypothetical protein